MRTNRGPSKEFPAPGRETRHEREAAHQAVPAVAEIAKAETGPQTVTRSAGRSAGTLSVIGKGVAHPYDAGMGRNTSRAGVIRAQLIGITSACALSHRLSIDEALAEIAEVLTSGGVRLGSDRAVELLSTAAATYVAPSAPGDEYWFGAALDFLVGAGADRERAAEIRRGTIRLGGTIR